MKNNEADNMVNDAEVAGSPADLYAKAETVYTRMKEMRERLDESVFVGESEDGVFRIGLYGDGRPASVEMRLDVPAEEKAPFENGVREALEDAYRLRTEALDSGLRAIQDETGVGPGFKVPF